MKYRIGAGSKKRDISTIIDQTQTRVRTGASLIYITYNTTTPHKMVNGERVILFNDSAYFTVTPVVTNSTSFTVALPLLTKTTVKGVTYVSENDSFYIHLEKDFDGKGDYGKAFPIYDEDGVVIISNCHFAKTESGEYIYDTVIVPAKFYTGGSFTMDHPITYIGNTLLFDWEGVEVTGLEDIRVAVENNYIDFRLPFQVPEEASLNIEEQRSELLTNEAKSIVVSDSIDMEKQMFEPYIIGGDKIKAQKIEFKMHFRNRKVDNKLTEGWSTSDDLLWNDDAKTDYSDNLLDLGFTDDDVRYQKKKLKKSFIRLLFFDSPDITSQHLLAYSTIFFDTNVMYSNYTKNIVKNGGRFSLSDSGNGLTRIDSQITVEDMYNFNASSEGFYLYLYPTTLWENRSASIYMKVEFNHARYGKIIPFIMPQDSNGEPIKFTDRNFPTGYLVKDDSGGINPDIQRYLRDMYTEVKVEYDEELNKYIYYFPWAKVNDERKITFTLFEPRINGFSS